jgi:hypothetical protein
VTVAAGAAAGTKATATAGTGNKLGYKLSAASIGGTALKDVHINALELDNTNYTSGTDIAGALAGQYLTVVAYNETTGLVVSSYEKVLASADIHAYCSYSVNRPTTVWLGRHLQERGRHWKKAICW